MIISHKYKFIFIKTKKTAGTSIEAYLSQFCGPNDIITPISPKINGHTPQNYKGMFNPIPEIISFYGGLNGVRTTINTFINKRKFWNHIPAISVKSRVPPHIWNSYFKFCFDRHPLDKTISHYYWMKYRKNKDLEFEDYMKNEKFCLNYPFYTDYKQQKIIVDYVGKYEQLNQELSKICNRIGIKFDGSLNVRAKGNIRKKEIKKDIFTEKNNYVSIIKKYFQKEIEFNDYSI